MASLQSGFPVCSWQYQLKQCLLGLFWQNFSVQDALPQLEVVAFSQEQPDLRQVSWLVQALAQGTILHPNNHLTQDGVCQLGLLPVFNSHTGDLQTVLYWVQDMQGTAVCFNGIHRTLRVASCMACTAAAVTQ